MSYKFNPFTDTLDLVGSSDSYIDGEVEYHSNLPVTVGSPAVNSAFLVRKGEGLYFISRKPAGIWVRELNNGNLDDWKFAGLFSDLYRDANFRIINDADVSKELAFDVSGVTTGTTRTLTVPDKSGTIATTSDLPDDYTVVTTAGNLANGDRAAADTTSAAFTLTLPASPANGDTIYVLDYAGTFDTNNLTIGRNGNNIESLAEDLVCNVQKAAFSLVYTGSTVGWKVVPQTAQMPSTQLANTWSVNQTLNGTNNIAPNQTAASGSSIMTRDLTDARFYPWSPAMHGFGSISGVAGGSTALGPWMMATRQDTNYNFAWGTDNSPAFSLPFFCNNGKSINTVRIQHTAGTHPTAVLEVGIYLANAQGLPDGYVEKVSFPLDVTGNKTQTLLSAFTPTGLFWVLIRPSLGDTSFKAGGNGVALQVRGHSSGQNSWAAGFFGAQKNGDITQYGGTIMPRRSFNINLLPTSSVASELTLEQVANAPQPTCILY
jgi:hypothetical protein